MTGSITLRLTNTMTRTKEDFVPLDAQDVRMYVCGPTVYDYAHIGNARPVVVFDVLFRLLRQLYGEDHVTYVRNITDVDDKINARALRDHPDMPLNDAIRAVTEKTAQQFHKDVAALGCLPPTFEPRATEFVTPRGDGKPDMLGMIATLIDKGHAYQAEGEVLFDTRSMETYGALSGRKLEDQQAGARIAVEAHKKNPADFVLWKLSSPEEPGWDSPWGRGRPGWHLECSVMSEAYLGQTFDIHGGGIDLVFPHHENERAQSCCAHDTPQMARYWLHNGFLQVEGEKMSKSLGNFITMRDLLETDSFGGRSWPGEVVRLALLMSHYREPLDFSLRKLEEAEKVLGGWYEALGEAVAGTPSSTVIAALSDDLNSSKAVAELHGLRAEAAKGDVQAAATLKASANLLGLLQQTARDWQSRQAGALALDESAIQARIDARLALIAAKNWAEADRIRDALLAEGVQLKDGKDTATGARTTSWEVKR